MLQTIIAGWQKHAEIRTQKTLGDRSKYLGLSDLAKAFTCPRAVIAKKVLPPVESGLSDQELLKRLRTFEKGHEQESGIVTALYASGTKFVHQLEIDLQSSSLPIVGHLDFVIFTESKVTVLESKANGTIPQQIYPEYEAQIKAQVGLLDAFRDTPVFSIYDENDDRLSTGLTLREVAAHCGVILQEKYSIEGVVLSMSECDAKQFGPYQFDEDFLNVALKKATYLWEMISNIKKNNSSLDEAQIAYGFNPLCDYCEFQYGCPKYSDTADGKSFDGMLSELASVKEQMKALKSEEEALKNELYKVGVDTPWYVGSNFKFKISQRTRSSFNKEKLREFLTKNRITESAIEHIFEECNQTSSFKILDFKEGGC